MKKYPISFIAGILAPTGYLIFTILAYLQYPSTYSPMDNWLSDLGNPELNPGGAIFYNLGIILTAIFLVIFFIGLSDWNIQGNRVQHIMLRLTQVFGIVGSLCMLMSAVFPINHYDVHSILSTSLYVLLSTAFIFSAAMLRYHTGVPRWLLVLGIFSAGLVISTAFLQRVYLLEWITVLVFQAYVILVGIETHRQYAIKRGDLTMGKPGIA